MEPPWAPTGVKYLGHLSVKGPLWKQALGLKGCGMGPWLVHVSPCFREM